MDGSADIPHDAAVGPLAPQFELRQVSKRYRQAAGPLLCALDEISLSIEAGSCVAFTGPSGSGKTTLLALLGALDRPSEGQVRFGGVDLATCSDVELARVRRRMGFILQDSALLGSLSAWENATYPLIPRGVPRAERLLLARSLFAQLDIGDVLDKRARELSGGEQQRVAIARALVVQPAVIIADEPTCSLDAASTATILAILADVHSRGTTVILSSHDLAVVALATRVYELRKGRLQRGT